MSSLAGMTAFCCAILCVPVLLAGDEALIAPTQVSGPPAIVKSVALEGGTSKLNLATRAGEPLDQKLLRRDVRALWATGRFTDIQVKTREEGDGTTVIFAVHQKPPLYLHDLRIEPNSFGMTPSLPVGTPIDQVQAQRVAGQIRRKLIEKGYIDANVAPELRPYGKNKADLLLHVTAGDSVRVKQVEIVGDTVFPQKDVARALQALRIRRVLPKVPGIWQGYVMYPAYSEEAVQSDLARLQSFYIKRGYFDARVSVDHSEIKGEDASLRLFVKSGPHYKVHQLEIAGKGLETKKEAPKYGIFQTNFLCSCLLQARRDAERRGVFDFNTTLSFHPTGEVDGKDPVVDLSAEIEAGRPYTVGRIEFTGAKHYKEATIRRNFLIDEGDLLDQTQIRKSLARLNQTQMFDPVEETQVAINTDERTGEANIIVPLHERKRGVWNISGPIGPVSFAGPLQGMIASRLPGWGQGLLELSSYYLTFSVIGFASPLGHVLPLGFSKQGILPVLSLFRPYTPGEGWKSGFLIAPQLGWQASLLSYGTTQVTSRLIPIISGSNHYTPQLAVTFARPDGDGILMCDAPKPRYHTARYAAAMLLQFIASTPIF